MKENKLSDKLKKNLLDMNYNKYLYYFNTSVILLFTYVIGILIGFITKQINYRSLNQMMAVAVVSILVVGVIILLLLNFLDHLRKIVIEMKKLKV